MVKTLKLNNNQCDFLDILRGGAAQLVLLGHLLFLFEYNFYLPIQNIGVIIFFVASGHLICLSALRLKSETSFLVKKFAIDRFLRIYTALLPALVVCVVIDFISLEIKGNSFVLNEATLTIKNFIFSAINLVGTPIQFIGNIVPSVSDVQPIGTMRPLWTVAIEWWLYIGMAFIFLFFSSLNIIFGVYVIAGGVLVAMQSYSDSTSSYYILYTWFFSAAITIKNLMAYIEGVKFKYLLVISLGLLFYITIQTFSGKFTTYYETESMLAWLLLYYILLELFKTIPLQQITVKFCKVLSSYSYSLYLVHYTLICFYLSFFESRGIFAACALYFVINVFSYLFYWLFERHYKTLRSTKYIRKLSEAK